MSSQFGTRLKSKDLGIKPFWADSIAEHLIARFPGKKKFVCAAGISPSGPVHFGNFREVFTAFAVYHALKRRGRHAECIFSWDDFDRFRKVPSGLDASFEEHIGKPLSALPSPSGASAGSYAALHKQAFRSELKRCNIDVSFRHQSDLYISGTYNDQIILAMQKRREIASVLLSFMSDKGKEAQGISEQAYMEAYYPLSIYSSFTGKDDTKILSYDGDATVVYRCRETGKEETVDLRGKHNAKLPWKVDWAMRWAYEEVCFEPGGSDHAAPGGSYDVSAAIAKKVFGYDAPVFTEYGFVGVQGLGSKMSSSSGEVITLSELLTVYEPMLILWMYSHRLPEQTFSLSFGMEVFRQYDELDAVLRKNSPAIVKLARAKKFFPKKVLSEMFKERTPKEKTERDIIRAIVSGLHGDTFYTHPVSFRQLVGLAQVAQWDLEKTLKILKEANPAIDERSVMNRLPLAKSWVTAHNKEEMIVLRDTFNGEAWAQLDEREKQYIATLHEHLQQTEEAPPIREMETFLYDIPKKDHTEKKELVAAQKNFFMALYRMLIGREKGPRLSTFLWATPRERLLKLLAPPHGQH